MMKMQIFGEFVLSGPQGRIDEKSLRSGRVLRLLVYILLNKDRDLTHQELIDAFWEDDGSRNPEGALKNLIYRLRAELKAFDGQELVLTLPGAYRWNPKVPVETDFEAMEQAARAARAEKDPVRKKQWCERAVSLYRNEVSARIAAESWLVSRITHFRLLYMEMAALLAEIYGQEEDWAELEALCRSALKVDPLDEDIHYWMLQSQIGRKNYEMAITCYENAKKQFSDYLGIRNVERIDKVYEEILAIADSRRSDMNGLMKQFCEEEKPRGVFTCEYPVFREIYRMEARRIQRTGIAEYLLLITMKKSGHSVADEQEDSVREGMKILGELMSSLLRTGDVVARYSSSQYVVLLPTCSYESALLVSSRIEERFLSATPRRRLSLWFEVEEVQMSTGSCRRG